MASDKSGKLLFEILGYVDPSAIGPRLGRLAIAGRKDLDTPNFFAITSRGATPHMTPDIISSHTQFGGVHIALEDCENFSWISRASFPLLTIYSYRKGI